MKTSKPTILYSESLLKDPPRLPCYSDIGHRATQCVVWYWSKREGVVKDLEGKGCRIGHSDVDDFQFSRSMPAAGRVDLENKYGSICFHFDFINSLDQLLDIYYDIKSAFPDIKFFFYKYSSGPSLSGQEFQQFWRIVKEYYGGVEEDFDTKLERLISEITTSGSCAGYALPLGMKRRKKLKLHGAGRMFRGEKR